MKIIKAKQSSGDKVAYINANRIDSFYSARADERVITKIYFGDHKCEIEGDRTIEIARFMSSDDDCGLLNLTEDEDKTEESALWKRLSANKGVNNNVTGE